MMSILYLFLVMLAGSIVQGATGFGFAIVSMPLVALFFPIKTTTIVVLIVNFILVLILSMKLRKHLSWLLILPVVIGSIVGRTIGIYALVSVEDVILRFILGIVLLLSSVYFIFGSEIKIKPTKLNGLLAGLISGVLGGMFNTAGPPLVVFYFAATSNKMEYQASFQATSLISAFYSILLHLFYGNINVEILSLSLAGVLAVSGGSLIGLKIFNMLSKNNLKRAISVLMAFMGIMTMFAR